MNNKKNVIIITLIIISFICFNYNKYLNNNHRITDHVRFLNKEEKLKDGDTFAILIEKDGSYIESNENTWPSSIDYVFNSEKSGCLDLDGELVPNSLSFNEGVLSLSSNQTLKCYVYFDEVSKLTLTEEE